VLFQIVLCSQLFVFTICFKCVVFIFCSGLTEQEIFMIACVLTKLCTAFLMFVCDETSPIAMLEIGAH